MNGKTRPISLTSRIVSPLELGADEVASWEKICATQEFLSNPFLSPYFVRAVALARPDVYVCVIQHDGEIAGFLPFQFGNAVHKALRAAEPAGQDMAGYFGLIATPGLQLDALTLLRLAGLTYLGFANFEAHQLDYGLKAEQPAVGHLVRLGQDGQPYWEELRGKNRKFVLEVERHEHQLEAEYGPLRFCFAQEQWELHLENLIEYKRQQYVRTGATDVFAAPWKLRLIRLMANSRETSCRGVVSTLHAGSTWVASHFGLRNTETLMYYFPVYNPTLSRYSPGHLLLKAIIESALGFGLRTIDLCVGNKQYKRRFANDTHLFYRGAWYRPGVRPFICRVLLSLKWRYTAVFEKLQSKGMPSVTEN